MEKYPEICKSAFIEHLTELQQKELFEILDKYFVRESLVLPSGEYVQKKRYDEYKQKVKDAIEKLQSKSDEEPENNGYYSAFEDLKRELKL